MLTELNNFSSEITKGSDERFITSVAWIDDENLATGNCDGLISIYSSEVCG